MKSYQWFLLGWSFGASIMWIHFSAAGLIRTREEWYKARMEKRLKKWREE